MKNFTTTYSCSPFRAVGPRAPSRYDIAGYFTRLFLLAGFILLTGSLNGLHAQLGAALDFDGTDDKVLVADHPDLQLTSNYTLEVWFKATTFSRRLLDKGVVGTGQGFYFDTQAGKLRFGNARGNVSGTTTLVAGQWYHAAAVFQSGVPNGLKVYLNGVLDGQATPTAGIGTANAFPLTIGAEANAGLVPFHGVMDEVRIWNIVRCGTEILQQKDCELTGSEPGLVAYYKFNEGIAGGNNGVVTTLPDLAIGLGGANHGTLTNFALSGAASNWVAPGAPAPFMNVACAPLLVPEANLQGNLTDIADGDMTPGLGDYTNFNLVNTSNAFQRTFTLQNTGTSNLTVSGIASSDAQYVVGALTPASPVPPNGSATFTVTFTPTGLGVQNAIITVSSDDCDEADYDFALTGTGVGPTTLGIYPPATILHAGGHTTVTPNAAPVNAVATTAFTSSSFNGQLYVDPATGVVHIYNAYPAGSYTVTVTASTGGVTTISSFVLTVGNPLCSTGLFSVGTPVVVGTDPFLVTVGDFNKDGHQDIATANTGNDNVTIRFGDGAGNFSGTTDVAVGTDPYAVSVGDFNGDGNPDFAAANYGAGRVSIRLGDGMGGFSAVADVVTGHGPYSVAIGDFNNDGNQDFATPNFLGNTVSVRLGNGDGTFSGITDMSLPGSPTWIALSDFNSDGKTDFATSNYSVGTVSIRLGDGLGGFSGSTNVPVQTNPQSVATGDFNNDGFADFAAANRGSASVSISLGDGAGNFSASTHVPAGGGAFSVRVADFNGDGNTDFAVKNYNAGSVSIRLGAGDGTFTGTTNLGTGGGLTMDVGDFNEDGYHDFVAANAGNTVAIRLGGPAEINVQGNSVSIVDGDATPTIADHTDFGTTPMAPVMRTFTIQNLGTTSLSLGAGAITLTGVDAALFAVSNIALPTTVVAGGSGTFVVTYTPVSVGVHTATVVIANDDCNEATYDFAIKGDRVCPAPTCPANFSVCENSANVDLTTLTYAPAGGTFSGTGVNGNMFELVTAGIGVRTITYSYTTACGTNTCSFDITVNLSPPVSILPVGGLPFSSVCVGTEARFLASAVDLGNPNVQSYGFTYSGSPTLNPGGQFAVDGTRRNQGATYGVGDIGTQTVDLTVAYVNGCSSVAPQHMITVNDTPTPTCPANFSVCENSANVDLTTLTYAPAGGTFSGTGVNGNMFELAAAGIGVRTITYSYTTACGTKTCSFDITVNLSPPVSILPVGGLPFSSVCVGTEARFLASAVDLGNPNVQSYGFTYSGSPTLNPGGQFAVDGTRRNQGATYGVGDIGTQTVDLTVAYVNGCSSVAPQHMITVNPMPTVSLSIGGVAVASTNNGAADPAESATVEVCNGGTYIMSNLVHSSPTNRYLVSVSGGGLLFNGSPTGNGDISAVQYTSAQGMYTITLSNPAISGTVVQVITPYNDVNTDGDYDAGVDCVGDPVTITYIAHPLPMITFCPVNQVVTSLPGLCAVVVNYTVTATGIPAPTFSHTFNGSSPLNGTGSGSSFYTGVTQVVVTASNQCGTVTCSFTVTVNDGQNPSIGCPANIVRNTDLNQCSAVVTYASPTFSDNCSGASIVRTSGLASGSAFPKGVNMVNWKVTDAAGNMAVCGFTVTVNDAQLPTISCPTNIVRSTATNLCSSAAVFYAVQGLTDNCPGVTAAFLGSQPTGGLVSGSIFPKGVTTVTLKATDGVGLTKICAFTVTVTDNQVPTIICPANQTRSTGVNLCTAIVNYVAPTATDNCAPAPSVTIQSGLPSGAAFLKGITTVLWKATDGAGLTKTCSFRVTVNDTQAPMIVCPANQVINTDAGQCTAVATYVDATFTDNCAGASLVKLSGLASGSAFPKGANNVIFKATDAAGNQSLCTLTITVTDAQLPGITCPANIMVTGSTSSGICSQVVPYVNPTATDNCAGVTAYLLTGLASYSVFPVGITTNVWRAYDLSGSSSTCSFTVTVDCGTGVESSKFEVRSLKFEMSATDHQEPVTMNLMPNPATAAVVISVEGLDENGGALTVLDATSRMVWQQTISQQLTQLNVADFPAGIYQVCLRTVNGVVTKSLVVSKL